MTYEELIKELCDVIKESEVNSVSIYENLEDLNSKIENFDIPAHDKSKIQDNISSSLGLLQHQDLHRQKIERVVNYVCEKNNIDSSEYNISNSAKTISSEDSEDFMSQDELDALIKSMNS